MEQCRERGRSLAIRQRILLLESRIFTGGKRSRRAQGGRNCRRGFDEVGLFFRNLAAQKTTRDGSLLRGFLLWAHPFGRGPLDLPRWKYDTRDPGDDPNG